MEVNLKQGRLRISAKIRIRVGALLRFVAAKFRGNKFEVARAKRGKS